MSINRAAAEFGTLRRGTATKLRAVKVAIERRDRSFTDAFGEPDLRRHPIREGLIRLVLIEFGEGRAHRASFYVSARSGIGPASSVAREIHLLEKIGAFALRTDVFNSRSVRIFPTIALVEWVEANTPTIIDLFLKTISRKRFLLH